MADPRFFRRLGPKSLEDLSKIAQAEVVLPEQSLLTLDFQVHDIAPIDLATPERLVVFSKSKYQDLLQQTKANVCVTEEKLLKYVPSHMAALVAKSCQKAYAHIAQAFYPDALMTVECGYQGVHPSAKLGKDVKIGAYVSIGENVEIGDGTIIGAHTSIGAGTIIGKNCHIHTHVTLSHSILGDDVKIYSGAKIGCPGFGFHMDQEGATVIPQLGRVIIHDKVEIGSNTCIDRGSNRDTVIGAGTHIDNLVQIAHNVEIGPGSVIVAQVGIAGSTKLGHFCAVGGQAGIADHVNIGHGVQIAARSGIMRDVADKQIIGGSPAVPIREWQRQVAALKRLGLKKDL